MEPIEVLLQRGLEYHQAGNFKDAEACYRQILSQAPQHAHAHYLLGTVAHQLGRHKQALQLIERALQLNPKAVVYYNNMASILSALGRFADAIKVYDQLLFHYPDDAQALSGKARVLRLQGKLAEAEKTCLRLLDLAPDNVMARLELGEVYYNQNNLLQALEVYKQLLMHDADNQHALIMLAQVYVALSMDEQAKELLGKIRVPQNYTHYYYVGNVLAGLNKYHGAIQAYQSALRIKSDDVAVMTALADAYYHCYHYTDAIAVASQLIKMQPDHVHALSILAECYKLQQRFDIANQIFKRLLQLQPQSALIRSYYLFMQSYHVLLDPPAMLEEHKEWDRIHGQEGRRYQYTEYHAVPGKKLRVGYVSPDFQAHSVSYFFEPILKCHHHDDFEIYCYAQVPKPDDVTRRLQSYADHWRSIAGLSDKEVARKIHDDGIDILVDLSGHTQNNRLPVFTYKPAPIQVSYLGYFTTTGLQAMDYWLTDEIVTPQDTIELTTETIYRLPRCCLSYQAPANIPDIVTRPDDAAITFGSFNDLSKLGPRVVPVWSEILKLVPGSRLLLKARQLVDEHERTRLRECFASAGIAAERLIMHDYADSVSEHLAFYGEVDIALDSMPRTGGTTTAEALWMGVPVVTLAGERFIERLSASMLVSMGLEEMIATNEQDYIETALGLAVDASRRASLRRELRQRMSASDLCDAQDLTRSLESAYRQMWQSRMESNDGVN